MHMAPPERVLIAGAGPVGMVAAANLVRHGVPVTVLEAGRRPQREVARVDLPPADARHARRPRRRAAADRARADRAEIPVPIEADGLIAQFDFAAIADATRASVPAAMRAVQTDAHSARKAAPKSRISRSSSPARCAKCDQDSGRVTVTVDREGRAETRTGRWLIGADGARSDARRACASSSKASPGRSASWSSARRSIFTA